MRMHTCWEADNYCICSAVDVVQPLNNILAAVKQIFMFLLKTCHAQKSTCQMIKA